MSNQSVFLLMIAAVIAGLAEPALSAEPSSATQQRESLDGPATESEHVSQLRRFLGVGSCAAANCHGGGGKHGTIGSEASIWIQQDPHAQAYSVLFDPRSRRMATLLKLDRPAHEAKLCLTCHAPQSDAPAHDALATHSVLTDGVSCEACHGAATEWLAPHVQYDWKNKSAEAKAALGFRHTKDLWNRSKMCADCHVGEPGRDVNHDLYAAGHPRLFFEMSAFNANMPAHWDRNRDRHPNSAASPSDGSSFEAKLWAVGTLASAEAALDLLIHRAEHASDDNQILTSDGKYPSQTTIPVWPEFAETGCFACHHDLQSPSWRQARSYPGRRPGDYPWGTWLFPLAPTVADELAAGTLSKSDSSLAQLTRQMGSPYPDRKKVVESATALRAQIEAAGEKVNSSTLAATQLETLLGRLAVRGRELTPQNWDAATQSYLGLVAVHQGYRDASGELAGVPSPDTRLINMSLEQIRQQLEFHPEYESPKTFGKTPTEAIATELDRIIEALK